MHFHVCICVAYPINHKRDKIVLRCTIRKQYHGTKSGTCIDLIWVWCLRPVIFEEKPLCASREVLIGCSWNLQAGWKPQWSRIALQFDTTRVVDTSEASRCHSFQDEIPQNCPKTLSGNGFRGQDLKFIGVLIASIHTPDFSNCHSLPSL